MTINHEDGQYALDCWEDAERVYDADDTELSDDVDELRARVPMLLKGDRFKYLTLFRWNADEADWDELETFTKDDVE